MACCDYLFNNQNWSVTITAKVKVKIRVAYSNGKQAESLVSEYTLASGDSQTFQRSSEPSQHGDSQGYIIETYAL